MNKLTLEELTKYMEYPIRLFDKNHNEIYFENDNGFWQRREFDKNNSMIYAEDSFGNITNSRYKQTKELSIKELEEILGYKVKIVKD